MTYAEEKLLREQKLEKIFNLSDTEKLEYVTNLLIDYYDKIDMLTDCSDTHGIDFTPEYTDWEKRLEDYLIAVKRAK